MEPLIIPGVLDEIGLIGAYVVKAASKAGLEDKRAYLLRLAVDEIATNAIVHGYEKVGLEGELVITAEIGEGVLTIVLEDKGPPYNPLKTPRPDDLHQPLGDRDLGGLGVFLAFQGLDEFRYERVGGTNRNIFMMNQANS